MATGGGAGQHSTATCGAAVAIPLSTCLRTGTLLVLSFSTYDHTPATRGWEFSLASEVHEPPLRNARANTRQSTVLTCTDYCRLWPAAQRTGLPARHIASRARRNVTGAVPGGLAGRRCASRAAQNDMAHERMLVGDRETQRAAPVRPQSGMAPEQRGMQQAACAAGWLSKIGVHHGGA